MPFSATTIVLASPATVRTKVEFASASPVNIEETSDAEIILSAVTLLTKGASGLMVSICSEEVDVSLTRPPFRLEVTETDILPWPTWAISVSVNVTVYAPSASEVTFLVNPPAVTATVAFLSAVPDTVKLDSLDATSLSLTLKVGTGTGSSSSFEAAYAIPPPANAPSHIQLRAKKPGSSIATSTAS